MAETDVAQSRTDFLRSLRAVREFKKTAVPEEALGDILEVARWSGSAGNQQGAEIVVIKDPTTLKTIAGLEGYLHHLAGAAVGLVIVMPGQWAEGDAYDEGRLAERIMLAAAAHGLGSSIGWLTGAGREAGRRLLNIPEGRTVRTVISIGYPATAARRGRRKPLDGIVHAEKYS
jgi:nitroreductase